MKEQRITNAERVERIDELEALIRLEVDGALHRHLCCEGMDASVSEALELLAEGFAVARAAGESLEDLRTFVAEHGLHVPVANGALLEDGSRLRPTKLSLITFQVNARSDCQKPNGSPSASLPLSFIGG